MSPIKKLENTRVGYNSSSEKPKRNQRHWTEDENTKILDYLEETVKNGFIIEKLTAPSYYKRMISKKGLNNYTHDLLRNKVRNFMTKYKEAIKWRDETGQGVIETQGASNFESIMQKRYPYFQQSELIWGKKLSVHIPATTSTAQVGPPEVSLNDVKMMDESNCLFEDSTGTSAQSNPDSSLVPQINAKCLKNIQSIEKDKIKTSSSQYSNQKKTARDVLIEVTTIRNNTAQEKLLVQKQQLQIEQSKVDNDLELNREKFEFEKKMRQRELDFKEIELNLRRDELHSNANVRLKELEVEKLKLEVEMLKYKN